MSIFYIDKENGNDANSGVDWANAWLTPKDGATLARITQGDIIRVAKSSDPTSIGSATWTNNSDEIALASSPVIGLIEGGNTWVRSANITGTDAASLRKIGSNSASLIVASGFTTGLIAYSALGGAEDLSGYQQISFQIHTTVAVAVSTLSIRLCSDVAGVTTVDTIVIPALPETQKYYTFTVDTAGALGASIQSVAIYADLDPGTPSLSIGQIIACKDSSSNDSLTLSSLISKSDNPKNVEQYPIRGIVGTTVYLDHKNTSANSTLGKYQGTTEAVVTYKRETIKTTPETSNASSEFTIQDTGKLGIPLVYSGGWNIATTIQDGLTIYDGQNGEGSAIYSSNKTAITLLNFGFTRYDRIYFTNAINYTLENILSVGLMDEGINATNGDVVANNLFIFGCDEYLSISGVRMKIRNGAFISNVRLTSTFSEIYSQSEDFLADNHWQRLGFGTINSNETVRHTASGISWELIPTVSTDEDTPLKFKIADMQFEENVLATVTVFVKKEHATNVNAKLILPGCFIAGVSSDVEDTKADDTDWEELSISFTPTETGVVSIYVYGWGNGTDSIYVDDISKS